MLPQAKHRSAQEDLEAAAGSYEQHSLESPAVQPEPREASKPLKRGASLLREKKMTERYQIFERPTGDRQAAKRVDYR